MVMRRSTRVKSAPPIAVAGAGIGCGGSDPQVLYTGADTGGSPPTGNTGGTSTGVTGSGGVTQGDGATGGTSSGAKAKFCHALTSNGQDITLTLDVNGTRISALTGNCVPTNTCMAVPTGTNVPVSLLDGTTILDSGTFASITAGEELLFRARLDSSSAPTLTGDSANGICSGGSGTTGTVAKFCNRLQRNGGDIVLTLNIGGASISAQSGTCAPVGTCASISSGTNLSMSLLEGSTTVLSGTFPTVPSGFEHVVPSGAR